CQARTKGLIELETQALRTLLEWSFDTGDIDTINKHLKRLWHVAASRASKSDVALRALITVATLLAVRGDKKDAIRLAEDVVHRAEIGQQGFLLNAHHSFGLTLFQCGDVANARLAFQRGFDLAAKNGTVQYQWSMMNNFGVLLLEAGDFLRAE